MLISVGGDVLNVKKIHHMFCQPVFKKTEIDVSYGFLGMFTRQETKEEFDCYRLEMKYYDMDDKEFIFKGCSKRTSKEVEDVIKGIVSQLKGFDNELVTAAFENAIFGDKP